MTDKPIFVRGRLSPRGVEGFRRLFQLLYSLRTTIEVRGLENVPPGGVLLCSNHLSRFDPPLVFMALPKRKITVFNADTYRSSLFFRFVMEMVDVIWVNRGAISPSVIKTAIRVLNEGSVLGVAPEGTRSKTGALQPGKTGAAFLAYASGAPIVPAAITNTDKVAKALLGLRRIPLTLTFGQPLRLGQPGSRNRPTSAQLEEDTTEIMCRIAAMLPPEYRGVYAEHPRMVELLGTTDDGRPPASAGGRQTVDEGRRTKDERPEGGR
jgi:1-acyl-sn-glycerol-3-phosphate acyltransferase